MSDALPAQMTAFLNFCRIEKGLSENSLQAYSADLSRFFAFLKSTGGDAAAPVNVERLRAYLDHLNAAGLGSRSVARHLTTVRSLYGYLLREGAITQDPTEHLRAPRQWQTIPKFLNLSEIDKIGQAIDLTRPTGLRDRAMLDLLFATGLRVSELCRVATGDLDANLGVLRATGKGNKQRLVPVGKQALNSIDEYLKGGRSQLLN